MSSSAAVYVDDTLVAYEAKRLFHEAETCCPGVRNPDFFGKKGSLNCLAKAITSRIDRRPIALRKRSEIRREVKKFLQYLEREGILHKEKKGPRHDKWLFSALLMNRLEVVNGNGVPIIESALLAAHKSKQLEAHPEAVGKTKAKPSYVNDSRHHRLSHA